MKTRKIQIAKARKMFKVLSAWQRMHWSDGIALIRTPLIGSCCNKYTNQFIQADMIPMLKTWFELLDVDIDGDKKLEDEVLRRGF